MLYDSSQPLFFCDTNDIYHTPMDVLKVMNDYFTVYWLSHSGKYVRKKKVIQCLSLATPEIDPEIRIRVLIINLGGNPRKCWLGIRDRRQAREGSQERVCLFASYHCGKTGEQSYRGTPGASLENIPQNYLNQGDTKLEYLNSNTYPSLAEGCLETLIPQHLHFAIHRELNTLVASKTF